MALEAYAPSTATEGAKARIQRALKIAQLFDRATRATRDAVLAAATHEVILAGAAILTQGAAPEGLVILGRGRVRIDRVAPDGRVVPLGYRGAGDVLGEQCLGVGQAEAESVIALEETEIIRIPAAVIAGALAADPVLAEALFSLVAARRREAEEKIESLLFRNVEGRVVEFLLEAAERWGVPNPRGTLISAPITHLEIAQSVGSTRETVTLTIGALRREGLLDVAGRRLIVTNRDALAAKHVL